MPSISRKGIQFLYAAVPRDGDHVADPSMLNDKESNMKVDLLPDVGKACFISLVKQRGKQSEHESMNNSRTFFLGNCLSCLLEKMAAGVETEVSASVLKA